MMEEARRLWMLFETEYGSKGVQSFDFPNITFQAGPCRDVSLLKENLGALAHQLQPFEVVIDGLGYFESPSKVVFLKVRPTADLRRSHQAVSEWLEKHFGSLYHNYLPGAWIPHVTVAMKDLTDEAFTRAMHQLRQYHPHYRQILANINLVHSFGDMERMDIIASARLAPRDRNAQRRL